MHSSLPQRLGFVGLAVKGIVRILHYVAEEQPLRNGENNDQHHQHHGHRAGHADLVVHMRHLMDLDEEGSRSVGAHASDHVGGFKGGKGTGDGQNQIQHEHRLDTGQNDDLELFPFIGAVNGSGFIQGRIDGRDRADEQHHVLTAVFPYRSKYQRPVVHALVAQPIRQVLQREAQCLQHGIQHEAAGKEEFENIADGNTVHQEREEQDPLEYPLALDSGREKRCEKQCERQLYDRSGHVVQTQQHCAHVFFFREDLQVILKFHEAPVFGITHIIEAEFYHFDKGDVGKQNEQEQRKRGKRSDQKHFLPVDLFSLPQTRRSQACQEVHLQRGCLIQRGATG